MIRIPLAGLLTGLIGALGLACSAQGDTSLTVYQEAIAPLMQARCVRCHGQEKVKGKLRLDSPAGFRAGGSGGPSLEAGHAENSELFIRITLPPDDEDHMPSQGKPLTPEHIALIRWWIDAGASFEQTLANANIPEAVRTTIANLDVTDPEPGDLPAATPVHRTPEELAERQATLAALQEQGVVASPLFAGSPLLDINFAVSDREITDPDLAALDPLASDIVSLNLAGTRITDEGLRRVAGLSTLARLHLEHTAITDGGLAHLASLPELKILNLVGTSVTDDGLVHLHDLSNLQALYLWQTQVTGPGINRFCTVRDTTEVVLGWNE